MAPGRGAIRTIEGAAREIERSTKQAKGVEVGACPVAEDGGSRLNRRNVTRSRRDVATPVQRILPSTVS